MILSALKTRLWTIDAACEASARDEIDRFYQEVKYSGSRFLCPPFEQVSSVWLKLIQRKERELVAEIERMLDAVAVIDDKLIEHIETEIENLFQDDRYISRLGSFYEGVARKASSYGIQFRSKEVHLDAADALYRAGVKNSLRATRKNINIELQLYISNRGAKMSFSALMTDTISVLKKDGNRFDGVKASVQKEKIFISGCTLLIESGDRIERKMSNGGVETFEVVDPGFHEKFHSIPAGYQMTVRKLGAPEAYKSAASTVFNVTGPNARIVQNSIDNSSNIVSVNPDAAECIVALRSAIRDADLPEKERQSATDVVDAVEAQFQSGNPRRPVVEALLAALPHIAKIATVASTLLSLVPISG